MNLVIVVATLLGLCSAHSPVLLWPAEEFAFGEGQSVLDKMNLDDFKKLFQGKKIIVFHKRNFNLEEVAYSEKPLTYLQTVDAVALQGVKSIHRFVGNLISSENLKFVRLADEELHEQQEKMKNAMETNPGFVAILVGSGSHRSRRAAPTGTDEVACSTPTNSLCMAYIKAISMAGSPDGKMTCEVECAGNEMNISIGGKAQLFVRKDLYGYNIKASDFYKLDTDTAWAPSGFSYSCGKLQLIANKPELSQKYPTITITRLQLYPGKGDKFPDSYDCATWFSTTLWMGTVVALIYIFILFGAVLFLLDVKTNDRFDDPKGKTITVNVSE